MLGAGSTRVSDDLKGGIIELKKDVRFQQNTSVRQAEHEAMLRRRLDWDESGAMAAAKCPAMWRRGGRLEADLMMMRDAAP